MVKVTFTNKQGARETVTMPNRAVAEAYARGVKAAVLTEDGAPEASLEVKVLRAASEEDTKRATNAYFKAVKNGEKFAGEELRARQAQEARREAFLSREQEAEQMAEHFAACRALGVSQEDAFADWDHARAARRAG